MHRGYLNIMWMNSSTGHRSNAVHVYERPTAEHDMVVSRVLQPPSPKKGKVSCDDAEPRIQEVKVVQVTASGIENVCLCCCCFLLHVLAVTVV